VDVGDALGHDLLRLLAGAGGGWLDHFRVFLVDPLR
jgi:hypothetical protein